MGLNDDIQAKKTWQNEEGRILSQTGRMPHKTVGIADSLAHDQARSLEQRKLDFKLAKMDYKLSQQKVKGIQMLADQAGEKLKHALPKMQHNPSFNSANYSKQKSFLTRRYSKYEYTGYFPMPNKNDIYSRLYALVNSQDIELPATEDFPRFTSFSFDQLDSLAQTGSDILLDQDFLADAVRSSQDEASMQDCLININSDLRAEANFLETRAQYSNLTPLQEQNLSLNPKPWAIAACELRAKAYLNAYRSDDGKIKNLDVSMLYRFFAMQESFIKRFPNQWETSEEEIDQELAQVLGQTAVNTGKLMADDYLRYLSSIANAQDMATYWDDAQKDIAQYPNKGLLNQEKLRLDTLGDKRRAAMDAISGKKKADANLRDPDIVDRLFSLTVAFCCHMFRLNRAKADMERSRAYMKSVQDLRQDYRSFPQRWARSHNGTKQDYNYWKQGGQDA